MKTLGENLLNPSTAHPLIERLALKRQLLAANSPEHRTIKTALVMAGGGMKGIYAGGVVTGLEASGMREIFDDVIGISAGACAGGYLLAGQAQLGTSIYYEDLLTKEFINLRRYKKMMDIGFLETIMRGSKQLDVPTIRSSRSRLHIGVTRADDGKGVYLDMADHEDFDMVSTIIASSSLPGVTGNITNLGGVAYVDGISGCHNPIDYAVNQLGATDVMVVINRPIYNQESLPASERFLNRLILRNFSQPFKEAHTMRYQNDGFVASNGYDEAVNIGVLCPETMPISQLSRDAAKFQTIAHDAETLVKSLFNGDYIV